MYDTQLHPTVITHLYIYMYIIVLVEILYIFTFALESQHCEI
jgi:hypothetical protein